LTEDVSARLEDAREVVVDVEIALEDLAREGVEAVTLERRTGEKVAGELCSALDAGGTGEQLVVRRADAFGVDQLRSVPQDAGACRLPPCP
jgi:hypothetical protein